MRRFPIHVALVLTIFAAIAPLATAATTTYTGPPLFTVPSKTVKTEVACSTCLPADQGKKSVGYQGLVSTFAGRYNDSALDGEGYSFPRPLRAWQMKYNTAHDRLYMRVGSYLVAYTMSSLLTRVQAGEPLQLADRPGDVSPAGSYLLWDKYVNVEETWPGGRSDGGDMLPDFDFDDRGNVYLTGGILWAMVKDDYATGGQFPEVAKVDASSARSIVSVKTSDGHYYAVISPETGPSTVYDVTTPSNNPTQIATLSRSFLKTCAVKTADGHWVAIVNANTNAIEIFTAEDFVFNRPPTFSTASTRVFRGVATDGINFYSAENVFGRLSISTFSPSGGTFSEHSVSTGISFQPERLHYGAGYLSVSGATSSSANDIHVYKVGSSGSLTELDLLAYASNPGVLKDDRYFPSYYSPNGVPSGYLYTIYNLIFDSLVVQKNGHTFLLVNAKGLGDVYELKGSDSLAAANKGVTGTNNPNSAQTGPGPYYGDKIVFGSTTTAPAQMNVNWNFGNPEANDNAASTTTGNDVTHQYSGITSTSQLAAARSVTVTNAIDSTIFDSLPVTLAVPAARAGIVGQPILFTIPNASSPAAIVTSDLWKDASDGTVEGHFTSWNIDGVTTKTLPNATVPVGGCGSHSLIFTANYGPYSGSGSTLTSTNGTLAQSINSVNYTSRPFMAIINAPTSDATNVTFTSGSRVTTDPAVVPSGTLFTYQWDLLNSAGASIQTTTGSATVAQVPSFVVARSTFTGVTGAKVRLQLSTTATLGAGCGSASTGTTGALSAPDPHINIISGCQYSGAPCNLSVTSASGADTSAWNVTWSFNPAGAAGGSGLTFSPTFSTSYSGSVIATVTNAIGSGSDSATLSIATPPCNTIPAVGDFAVSYGGTTPNCAIGGTCTSGERITFVITTFTYHWSATCDQYLWTFGDGATATGRSATHNYTGGNGQTFNGSFTLTVGSTVLTFPFTVRIGTPVCTVNCGSCPQITDQSVFATYNAATSGCSYANSTPCQTGESVQFNAAPNSFAGYLFSCGTHTFSWAFGDGATGSGQQIAHTYATGGNYTAQVTVNSPTGTMIYTVPITVTGGGSCSAPTAGNTAITVAAPSGCNTGNPNCRANEVITLGVGALGGYSFGACAHTFVWDFGDGGDPTSAGQTITHSFSSAQSQYTVHVTVTNQSGSVTLTKLINIAAVVGNCTKPTSDLVYLTYSGPNNCSYATPEQPCPVSQLISFNANPNTFAGYNFNNCSHTFAWTFDDGTTSTTKNPTHSFTQERTYNVSCVITNAAGSLTLNLPIIVGTPIKGQPEVTFAWEAVTGSPTLIKFTPSVTPPTATIASWKWEFGDNSDPVQLSGTSVIPQYHLYTNPGNYTVTLTTSAGVVTKQVMVGTAPRPRPSRH